MDLSSKEFNGKLIGWLLLIGAIIIFSGDLMDMTFDSLSACEMVEESMDKFFGFWEGEYDAKTDSWLSWLGRTNL